MAPACASDRVAPSPLAGMDVSLVHTANNAATRPIICSRCCRVAAPLAVQHALATGAATRLDLRRCSTHQQPAALPHTASTSPPPREATPCWCDVDDACTEAYCSEACRDAARPAHALLCTGGLDEAAPLAALRTLAKAQPQDEAAVLLAAQLVAETLAAALAGTPAADAGDCASRLAALCDVDCAQEVAGEAGEAGEAPTGRAARRRRAEAEARLEAIDEARNMLRLGVRGRVPPSERHVVEALLGTPALFTRIVTMMGRRALPLQLAHPLVGYCERLGACACARVQQPALRRLLPAAEPARRADERAEGEASAGGAVGGHPALPDDGEGILDQLLREEGAQARLEASRLRADGDVPAFDASDAAAVDCRRRANLLAQCAPRLFPPSALLAFVPSTMTLRHSCVPTLQLQPLPHGTDLGAASPPPLLRAALVPVRARGGGGEVAAGAAAREESIAWVDVSAHPSVDERAAMLRRAFGDGFVCVCERCGHERRAGAAATAGQAEATEEAAEAAATTTMLLSRDAIEDGRYVDAIPLLRSRLRACGADGEAWVLLGLSLLNVGRWTEAHAAWRRGALSAPSHPLLAQQRRKEACYAAGAAAAGAAAAAAAAAAPVVGTTRQMVHEGTGRAGRVVCTAAPVLSAAECAAAIRFAEEHASSAGGWSTSRHYAVPTTDLPVHEVPRLLDLFNDLMERSLAPMLSVAFGVAAADVRVHDAFIVRYAAGRQAHLPLHADESELSLTLPLNPKADFVGGGTYFADLRASLSPEAGHVIAFDGHLFHAGEPIVSGTRYIIAAFLYVHDDRAERKEAARHAPAGTGPPFTLATGAAEAADPPQPVEKRARVAAADGGGEGGSFCFNFA